MNILIAEDHYVVRSVLLRMLRRLGHGADVACDGQETVDMLGRGSYDLLLLDLTMPRLNGDEVVRWMNAELPESERPVVVIVSASAYEERPVLQELGVELLLQKPVRQDDLARVLSLVAGRPRQ